MQDKLYLFAGAKLPEGASLNRTDAVTRQMVETAKSVDGVDMVAAFAGFNALQSTTTPNLTSSYIMLKPFGERTAAPRPSMPSWVPSSRRSRAASPMR
jgi:multidrug efflux pump